MNTENVRYSVGKNKLLISQWIRGRRQKKNCKLSQKKKLLDLVFSRHSRFQDIAFKQGQIRNPHHSFTLKGTKLITLLGRIILSRIQNTIQSLFLARTLRFLRKHSQESILLMTRLHSFFVFAFFKFKLFKNNISNTFANINKEIAGIVLKIQTFQKLS